MYILKTEASFDSAHFLAGYEGKCSNIHGHRWKIILEVKTEELKDDVQHRGMYVDFGELKKDLRQLADSMDHALIIEKNTLDCILIGPQTKFLFDEINKKYGDKTPVMVIDPTDYGMMDAEKVLKKAIVQMKKFKNK